MVSSICSFSFSTIPIIHFRSPGNLLIFVLTFFCSRF
jgi:hypothetical protein